MIITTKNEKETEKVGEMLALEMESGQVICLKGDLGGGKTTFTKGFARGLEIKQHITSPTFVIMKEYSVKKQNIKKFYHLDCYRISSVKDIEEFGIQDIIKDTKNIVIIEWAEKIARILPKDCLTIEFMFIDEKTRKISIISHKLRIKNKKNSLAIFNS